MNDCSKARDQVKALTNDMEMFKKSEMAHGERITTLVSEKEKAYEDVVVYGRQ